MPEFGSTKGLGSSTPTPGSQYRGPPEVSVNTGGLRLPAEPRVDPPVDLIADPLDQALGDGRVVPWPQFGVGGHGHGDLVPLVDVHANTLCRKRHAGKQEKGTI